MLNLNFGSFRFTQNLGFGRSLTSTVLLFDLNLVQNSTVLLFDLNLVQNNWSCDKGLKECKHHFYAMNYFRDFDMKVQKCYFNKRQQNEICTLATLLNYNGRVSQPPSALMASQGFLASGCAKAYKIKAVYFVLTYLLWLF